MESLRLNSRVFNLGSEGLRFDSSWGLRFFSLSHARDKAKNWKHFWFIIGVSFKQKKSCYDVFGGSSESSQFVILLKSGLIPP